MLSLESGVVSFDNRRGGLKSSDRGSFKLLYPQKYFLWRHWRFFYCGVKIGSSQSRACQSDDKQKCGGSHDRLDPLHTDTGSLPSVINHNHGWDQIRSASPRSKEKFQKWRLKKPQSSCGTRTTSKMWPNQLGYLWPKSPFVY
jgi:hypothetical protein